MDRKFAFNTLPASTPWAALNKLTDEHRRLVAERREVGNRKSALEEGRRDAVAKDNEAAAVALRAKKADPGQPHVEAWKKDLDATTRRYEVLSAAIGTVEDELVTWHAANRAAALAELQELNEKADERFLAAVGDLEDAAAERGRVRSLRWWIEDDSGKRQFGGGPGVPSEPLPSLIARNDQPYTVPMVTRALRGVVVANA